MKNFGIKWNFFMLHTYGNDSWGFVMKKNKLNVSSFIINFEGLDFYAVLYNECIWKSSIGSSCEQRKVQRWMVWIKKKELSPKRVRGEGNKSLTDDKWRRIRLSDRVKSF